MPAAAVVDDGAERFVLVEEANTDEAAEFRKVSVAVVRRSPDAVEVRSGGLFPGDRVVTRGAANSAGSSSPTCCGSAPRRRGTIGLEVEPAGRHAVDDVVEAEGLLTCRRTAPAAASSQLAGTILWIRADRGRR